MSLLRVCDLTARLTRYLPSLQLQELLVELRKADEVPVTLLLVQHAPVYTIGKRGCSSADFRHGEQVCLLFVLWSLANVGRGHWRERERGVGARSLASPSPSRRRRRQALFGGRQAAKQQPPSTTKTNRN